MNAARRIAVLSAGLLIGVGVGLVWQATTGTGDSVQAAGDALPHDTQGIVVPGSSLAPEVQAQVKGIQEIAGPQFQACAQLWVTTRERVKAETGSDGEGRKAADEARAACEQPVLDSYNAAIAEVIDRPDTSGEKARFEEICKGYVKSHPAALKSGGKGLIGASLGGIQVYFADCAGGDAIAVPFGIWKPVIGVPLSVQPTSINDALTKVFTAWATETTRGYFRETIDPPKVRLIEGVLTADFSSAFHDKYSFSTSGQISRFVAEIGANGFQFQVVDSIRITVDGDCGTFWGGTAYGACMTLFRDGLR
ncbi:MAG: GerMN domain-containing protein [Actinobacteria bacterium]|nr:GerMN domain-containing protein [Actinomycetota bacterium]